MNKSVLVIAAHADDEVLGCGGTIAKHVAQGDQLNVIFMADGVKSRLGASKKELDRRMAASREAQKILGFSEIAYLDLPDNKMDSLPMLKIIQLLEPLIQKFSPQIIYTHHHGDLNIDHRITQCAVMTVCRPQPGTFVNEILGFEILSSTEWATNIQNPFLPNLFIDVSDYLSKKVEALLAYHEEMRTIPHSRSIDHASVLAKHRGYSIGVNAAEAFFTYRIIR